MFSKDKPEPVWPDVPPSLNHDSFELSDARKPDDAPAPPHDTAGDITPYLGLRARLSQIWFNRWTVLLILVLVRVLILIGSLNTDLGEAKQKALSACTDVEDIGSAMASMPHYLSVGVNQLTATSIEKAVHAMVDVLMDIITGVEAIILFAIDIYIGTYVCLTTALIHGALDLMVAGVNDTTQFMNSAITSITGDMDSAVASIQSDINSVFSKISDASEIFGDNFTPPQINLTAQINELRNIQVNGTQFAGGLTQLNTTIPTFSQVENYTKDAISIPLNLVKTMVNSSWGGYTFDQSAFPVAQKQSLTFCSDNNDINNFFQDLYEIAATAKIAFVVAVLVLAVLVCIPMTWLEIRRYRKQRQHAQIFIKHGFDPMDVVYIASRPVTATAGIRLASRFSGKRQLLVRWAVAYGTSFPALFVLSLALAGFLSCLGQLILLRAIQKEAPALAAEVGDFAADVVNTLESASQQWANDTNRVITNFNNDINSDVLGYVMNATTAVNTTLVDFQSNMTAALNDFFGNTPLAVTVNGVVNCLLGLKIDAIEAGLTWVQDNAHVDFPLLPDDIFSVGANESISGDSSLTSFLATPSTVTTDQIDAAVDQVINALQNSLVQEALISTGLLLVYVIVVLLGIVCALARLATPGRTRGDGGQRFYTDDGRPPLSPRGPRQHWRRAAPDAAATRFPQFNESSSNSNSGGGRGRGDGSAATEDWQAMSARDEKLALAAQAQQSRVRGGKAGGLRSPGHSRGSSYGQMEDADM